MDGILELSLAFVAAVVGAGFALCALVGALIGWCGKHKSGDPNDKEISHGICPECEAKFEREAAEDRARREAERRKQEGKR